MVLGMFLWTAETRIIIFLVLPLKILARFLRSIKIIFNNKRTWFKGFLSILQYVTKFTLEQSYCKAAWENNSLDTFHASVPFLYLMKMSENIFLTFSAI